MEAHEGMPERLRNVFATIATYRARFPENVRIDEVMTQLERVQSAVMDGTRLSFSQKDSFNFNLVEGTPLEKNENLVAELQSIRNFASNAL